LVAPYDLQPGNGTGLFLRKKINDLYIAPESTRNQGTLQLWSLYGANMQWKQIEEKSHHKGEVDGRLGSQW